MVIEASLARPQVDKHSGVTVSLHLDREGGSNRVGLIAEIPDMAAFQEFMQTDAAAGAMKHDGVRPATLLILAEG